MKIGRQLLIKYIPVAIVGVLLLIGGFGEKVGLVTLIGLFSFIILLSFYYLRNGRLNLPKGFELYVLFLLLFNFSLFWSKDSIRSLEFLILFTSGGLAWLFSYNFRKILKGSLAYLIIGLGIVFAFFYIHYVLTGGSRVNSLSLFLPISTDYRHERIGDLWAIVLLVIVNWLLSERKKKSTYFPPLLLGSYFLLISYSRSAYVAFAGGLISLFGLKGWFKSKGKLLILFGLGIFSLFVIAGLAKPTLTSHPYFFQSLAGFLKYPFGVGVGNFSVISSDPATHILGMSDFSTTAHNIVLELLSGMGVLSLVFVAWFIYILKNVWQSAKANPLITSVFFAITIHFLFDSMYLIPTMHWIWFVTLGLVEK